MFCINREIELKDTFFSDTQIQVLRNRICSFSIICQVKRVLVKKVISIDTFIRKRETCKLEM